MTNLSVTSRLTSVKARIQSACLEAGRDPESVTLLAVSKTKPLADILEAYEAGQRDFGENYAQETIEKCQQSILADIQWHFIGPLQSNKTRPIAESVDWVHTIDRLKIAQRLSDQRPSSMAPLKVLIQVNISDDPAKAGVTPSQVGRLAEQIAALPNLEIKGLMTITAAGLNETELASQFRELKNLQTTLIKRYSSCTEVSMGMSNDFELAIACGATMVRIGSDIFGARAPKPNSGA